MTHTAGLTYRFFQEDQGTYELAGVSDGMDWSEMSLEENLQRLASAPLLYEPGNMWRYSIATDVLGAVIEKVTGMSLREAVQTLVTHPLRMTDTDFVAVDSERLTAAYANGSEELRLLHKELELIPFIKGTAAYLSGGAGMVGTTGDFLTLLEALRQGGQPLLTEAVAAEMSTNQIGDLVMPYWPGRGFGLGFTVLKDPVAAGTPESPVRGGWVELTVIPGLLIQKKNLVLQHSPTRHLKGCRASIPPISVVQSTQAFVKAKRLHEYKYE